MGLRPGLRQDAVRSKCGALTTLLWSILESSESVGLSIRWPYSSIHISHILCICMCVYIHIYIYVYVIYMYIYICYIYIYMLYIYTYTNLSVCLSVCLSILEKLGSSWLHFDRLNPRHWFDICRWLGMCAAGNSAFLLGKGAGPVTEMAPGSAWKFSSNGTSERGSKD